MRRKIVVAGSSNTDMIVKAPRIPGPGETILGGSFSMAAGGKGANQAVAAGRAGGEVTLIACVGKDLFGDNALAGFTADGIDVGCVVRHETAPSGVALIIVNDDGENSIAVAPGANGLLLPSDIGRFESVIASARILVVQLETPMESVKAAVEIAARSRVTVILNPAPASPVPSSILRHVDFLTPNEHETRVLTGIEVCDPTAACRATEALLSQGIKTVIITMGTRGAYVATGEKQEMIPAFPVRAVDTTGAGDVFNGALAVALAEDRVLPEAVRFAAAAAALSVTRLGAQPSIPMRDEIDRFLSAKH